MIRFTSNLYSQLLDDLDKVAAASDSLIQKAKQSSEIIYLAIQQINNYIIEYSFKNEEEEIRFFKEVKPKFLKELYYYKRIYNIEKRLPIGSSEQAKEYYNHELRYNSSYFRQNELFFNYYRTNETTSDNLYFLRSKTNVLSAIDYEADMDYRCCTVFSHKLAKLQAYELVHEHLLACIYKLDHPEIVAATGQSGTQFFWTGGKNELTEVLISWFKLGVINHGRENLSSLARGFGLFLNVDLGNFHRAIQNMKIRKKAVAPFMDRMKEGAVHYMTEED